MIKMIDYRQFQRIIKKENCTIVFNTYHSSDIYDFNGDYLCSFSIRHSEGSKDQVKYPYVKQFQKSVKALKERKNNE